MRQYPSGKSTGAQKYKEWLIWAGFSKGYIEKQLNRYHSGTPWLRELLDLL